MGIPMSVGAFKAVFASTVVLCLLGWISVVQTLHGASMKCTNQALTVTAAAYTEEWQASSTLSRKSPSLLSALEVRQLQNLQDREELQLKQFNEQFAADYPPPEKHTALEVVTGSNVDKKKKKVKPPDVDAFSTSLSYAHGKQRRLRVLMGIFTYDSKSQQPYRRQFRKLFDVFPKYNDTRVCSLYDFEHAPNDELRYECQFIYTFVVGGNRMNTAKNEIVDDNTPLLIGPKNRAVIRSKDISNNTDVTFLNIRENMNDGKSQTWFKYATTIMEQYDLDYVGKLDSDSLPYLDKFFSWAYSHLPPPPFNRGILAGVPIDKLWWQRTKGAIDQDVNEDFFKSAYGKVMHLYAAGQCYIMSKDLAHVVVREAPHSKAYQEGPEDHDISAMAFHSREPISFHFLTLQQQFWKHPVKRYKKKQLHWRTLWHNENVRMKKVLTLQHEGDANVVIPEQLAAPVQEAWELEAANGGGGNGGEEEEEEEEEETGGEVEEEQEAAAR